MADPALSPQDYEDLKQIRNKIENEIIRIDELKETMQQLQQSRNQLLNIQTGIDSSQMSSVRRPQMSAQQKLVRIAALRKIRDLWINTHQTNQNGQNRLSNPSLQDLENMLPSDLDDALNDILQSLQIEIDQMEQHLKSSAIEFVQTWQKLMSASTQTNHRLVLELQSLFSVIYETVTGKSREYFSDPQDLAQEILGAFQNSIYR